MKEYPYARNRIARYLTSQIDALSGIKTQREIAQEAGYDNVNVLSMFKRGQNRVPLDKIPALAKALNVDMAFMFRLGLEQFFSDNPEIMGVVFKQAISDNELKILEFVREASNQGDPPLTTVMKQKIEEALA